MGVVLLLVGCVGELLALVRDVASFRVDAGFAAEHADVGGEGIGKFCVL